MLGNVPLNNFEAIHKYIIENQGNLKQRDALNIFIYSCNICCKCSDEISSSYLLETILKEAFCLISNLNEKELTQYSQSIFHIVKYLTDKVSDFSLNL